MLGNVPLPFLFPFLPHRIGLMSSVISCFTSEGGSGVA